MQQQTPQGLALAHNVMALPMGASLGEKSGLWVTPANIKIVGDEDLNDKNAYMSLIHKAEDMTTQQRAQRSGISLPGSAVPSAVPKKH
jgi:hypothetical protein